MRIAIVGPGALGSVIGEALARNEHEVTLVGRATAHLLALRENGLILTHMSGDVERVSMCATDEPAAVAAADAIVVLVKSYDTVTAMNAIQPHVHPGHVILTLQNGLGNVERIREVLGDGPSILSGVTSQAATRTRPGAVVHAGAGPTLIGFTGDREKASATKLAAAFSAAGLPAVAVPDIERWVWQKLAVNAAINGLTALGDFPNGVIASVPGLLDAAETIGEEVASVARAKGIEIGGTRSAIRETAVATTGNRSSMLQDLETGRRTEVDAIHGAILEVAAEMGIATPALQVIAALIRAKEQAMTEPEVERRDG